MTALPYLDGPALGELVPMERAVRVLEDALRDGLDPEDTPRRPVVEVPAGQILLMPAAHGRHAGIKIATVAPANPDRGLPRIQGTYLLLDGRTLTPLAAMDGIALTALRTPAVSALAVRHLAAPGAREMVVFGTGPQAAGHVAALRAVRPIERLTVAGRDPDRTARFAARHSADGLTVEALSGAVAARRPGGPESADATPEAAASGDRAAGGAASGRPASDAHAPYESPPVSGIVRGRGDGGLAEALGRADLIVCCTTARSPLFDGALVRDGAVVVAVGSHEPGAREVAGDLVARATLVVEARSVALAEAGDVVMPLRDGTIGADHIAGNLADLVNGAVRPGPGPRVFKSVGMAWEDLAVASAAYEAWAAGQAPARPERGRRG